MLTKLPIGLVWAIWLLILLLELATPPAVVLGILMWCRFCWGRRSARPLRPGGFC